MIEAGAAKLMVLSQIEHQDAVSDYHSTPEIRMHWKLFSPLFHLNREGEPNKYTFGAEITSRKEQGQFIPCVFRNLPTDTESSSYCQIVCHEDGSFWIHNLMKGEASTFVNGVRISQPTKLRWGDIISLGISGVGEACFVLGEDTRREQEAFLAERGDLNEDYEEDMDNEYEFKNEFAIFIFHHGWRNGKDEALKKDMADVGSKIGHIGDHQVVRNQPRYETALNKSLILSLIFGYLPLSSVKECRLVSKHWAFQGARGLKKRSTICFNFSTDGGLQFLRYVNDIKGFRHPNWKIMNHHQPYFLEDDDNDDNDDEDDMQELEETESYIRTRQLSQLRDKLQQQKYISDSKWFMGPDFRPNVKNLVLDFRFGNLMDFQLWTEILTTLASTIINLELTVRGRPFKFIPQEFPQIMFPNLRDLYLAWIGRQNEESLIEGAQNIIHRYRPFISSMMSSSSIRNSVSVTLDSKTCNEWNVVQLQEIVAGFVNLQEIAIHESTTMVLELLLKLKPHSLQQMELHKVEDHNLLNKLLLQQSKSLKDLQFTLTRLSSDSVTFPKMPELNILRTSWKGSAEGKIFFTGFEDRVNYEETFPKLQCLEFHVPEIARKHGTRKTVPFPTQLESFFPRDTDQVCKTLVSLSISYDGDCRMYDDDQIRYIAAMFPNVKIWYMRKGPKLRPLLKIRPAPLKILATKFFPSNRK